MKGPNFELLNKIIAGSKAQVILSGGISKLADLENCARIPSRQLEGVIIGKALYEKVFSLREAFKIINTVRS